MPAYNPPPQVLFSPVTNYYQGKAIRLQQAMQQKELDTYDEKMQLDRRRVDQTDRQLDLREDELLAATEAALGEKRTKALADAAGQAAYLLDNGHDPMDVQERFEGQISGIIGPEAYEQSRPQWDRNGDGTFGEEDWDHIKAFAITAGTYEPDEPETRRRTLTHDEVMALPGMTEDRAKNAVVQQDDLGQIFIDDAPTGLTAEDVRSRRTAAQEGGAVEDFLNNTVGASSAVMTGIDLLDIAFNNPEAIGVPGKIMTWGANLVEGSKSLMDWAGMQFAPEVEDPEAETELQKVGSAAFNYKRRKNEKGEWIGWDYNKLGISSAEATKFQAGIYGIAFAAAVSEQGTRPTDKDIQQFIDQIGGRASNPKAFKDTIFWFMRRQNQRLNIIADTKGITGEAREDAFEVWTPRFRAFVIKYATTSGLEVGRNPATGEVQIIHANGRKETF